MFITSETEILNSYGMCEFYNIKRETSHCKDIKQLWNMNKKAEGLVAYSAHECFWFLNVFDF